MFDRHALSAALLIVAGLNAAHAEVVPTAPQADPPVADQPGLRIHPKAFVSFASGQIAGMGNVILNPTMSLGLSAEMSHSALPALETDFTVAGVYGKVQSTNAQTALDETSRPGLQEIRGRGHAIYRFYNDNDVAKAGVGLYVDFAHTFREKPRYVPQDPVSVYAAEENETIRNQFDTGIDFNFTIRDDRISSDLHNVLFTSGNRIGPNLLTYKPVLGFMWGNQFYLTGDVHRPGWVFLTDMEFYFARKAGVKLFNSHDGLGGTKREIYLSYGVAYNYNPDTVLTVRTYGYNNLNRGSSAMSPFGFKDGLSVTYERKF